MSDRNRSTPGLGVVGAYALNALIDRFGRIESCCLPPWVATYPA
jgi:hypothetical protein